MWQQNSLHFAAEETISDPEARTAMIFVKEDQRNGYEMALSILLKTGWSPELVYDQYFAPELPNWQNIRWWKLKRNLKGRMEPAKA